MDNFYVLFFKINVTLHFNKRTVGSILLRKIKQLNCLTFIQIERHRNPVSAVRNYASMDNYRVNCWPYGEALTHAPSIDQSENTRCYTGSGSVPVSE